jgi:hypothetical protein
MNITLPTWRRRPIACAAFHHSFHAGRAFVATNRDADDALSTIAFAVATKVG